MKTHSPGFSLLELLITCSIIVILSAIALPLYSDLLLRADRVEAKARLYELAAALEKTFARHESYAEATLENLGFQEKHFTKHYEIQILDKTKNHFLISAQPLQDDKAQCGSLSLNEKGQEKISESQEICWKASG